MQAIIDISRTYWRCRCDCGNEVILRKDSFIYPYSKIKSCGCWHIEESSKRPKDKKTGKFIRRASNGEMQCLCQEINL